MAARGTAMRHLRSDPDARAVMDFLKAKGASAAFLGRLSADLFGLPAEYARRMANWTRGERAERAADLADKTRKLSIQWARHSIGQHWSILPHMIEQGGKARCDRLEVLTNGRVVDMPTVAEFLASLADAMNELAPSDHLLNRRMKLETFAVLWCFERLVDTGLYTRRPIAHAARLASVAVGKPINQARAKKIIERATR